MRNDTAQLMFFNAAPLPEPNLSQMRENQQASLDRAINFAFNLIDQLQPPTTNEFIELMTAEFGYNIRLELFEIVESLRRGAPAYFSDYLRQNLNYEQLETALQGANSRKLKDENTIDELFARSKALQSPANFVAALKFVAKLREYSPYNNMLVYLQRPTATHWASAAVWRKNFGRRVKPDALPIVILQTMGPVMLVYDVADTEGSSLPPGIGSIFQVEGDLDYNVYLKTLESCRRIGIIVKDAKLKSNHAGFAIKQGQNQETKLTIELNQAFAVNAKYVTLCHELAHIFLGHLGGDPYGNEWTARISLNRNQRELEAEAVAYLICARAGLTAKSDEYLAGYITGDHDLAGISIDKIMKTAGYIERMGRELIRPRTNPKNAPAIAKS